jgi:hypothetical protein
MIALRGRHVESSFYAILFLGGLLGAGCKPTGGGSAEAGFGTECTTPTQCTSGICVEVYGVYDEGYCSMPCDKGCLAGYACGTGPDGAQACMRSCTMGSSYYACIDGAPVACAVVDQTHCDDCGCPESLRCESGVGCVPLSDVGGPCTGNSDCTSNNCSTYLGICRTPVWAPCTVDNCDICMTVNSTGETFCTRVCDGPEQCNGGPCIGSTDTYFCERPCSGCSTPCEYTYDYDASWCDCTDCTGSAAPRPLGVTCSSDEGCQSGTCYSVEQSSESSSGLSFYDITGSLCTATCTTDADCSSAGLVCGNVPCASDQTDHCGLLCMTPCGADGVCESGSCFSSMRPDGLSVTYCDLRHADGGGCYDGSDCLSSRCSSQRCVPAGGAANGTDCAVASDCASGTCTNGVCRGSALIGGACAVAADCAVGTCCSATATCGTSC